MRTRPSRALRSLRLGVTLLAVGALFAGCGSEEPEATPPPSLSALKGAPEPLAALHGQANRLLGGGKDAYRARLRELRGYPVVVNKWASWCGPCRAEFPHFQQQATKRGKKIAFLGVDSNDNDANARKFLRKFPVPYPSFRDADSSVSAEFNAVQAFPSTAFYDRKGKVVYLKQGGYSTEKQLAADIDRYAR